ncbi:trehalose-6-phosphatase [Lachnospiraceae bacterium PF1-22]
MSYQESLRPVRNYKQAIKQASSLNRLLVDPVEVVISKCDIKLEKARFKKGQMFLWITGERHPEQKAEEAIEKYIQAVGSLGVFEVLEKTTEFEKIILSN